MVTPGKELVWFLGVLGVVGSGLSIRFSQVNVYYCPGFGCTVAAAVWSGLVTLISVHTVSVAIAWKRPKAFIGREAWFFLLQTLYQVCLLVNLSAN